MNIPTREETPMATATAKALIKTAAAHASGDDRFDPFAEGAFDPAETPIGAELAAEHTGRTETTA